MRLSNGVERLSSVAGSLQRNECQPTCRHGEDEDGESRGGSQGQAAASGWFLAWIWEIVCRLHH